MRDHPHLQHLTPHEREVRAEFLCRLQERYGDRISHVWLFGSKARPLDGERRGVMGERHRGTWGAYRQVLDETDQRGFEG